MSTWFQWHVHEVSPKVHLELDGLINDGFIVMSMGCSESSPLPTLWQFCPRIKILITMRRNKVGDVEGVAHQVLM